MENRVHKCLHIFQMLEKNECLFLSFNEGEISDDTFFNSVEN